MGFAVGNYVGLLVEEKLAIGSQLIRIITTTDASILINNLREKGFGATAIDAEGKNGLVHVIFVTTRRKVVHQVIGILNHFNPKTFYSIEDIRSVNINNTNYVSDIKKISSSRWMRKEK